MSRLFFFIQEAFRALRRNARAETAAIVTTSVTVILLGVLIPIFQTASAKSDEVAASSTSRSPSTPMRRRPKPTRSVASSKG